MLWVKSLHLIFMVTWFAGLFYLPRLFVYHAMAEDQVSRDRFKIMERKLFMIMTIGAVVATGFGVAMLAMAPDYLLMRWLHVKLALVLVLVGYHGACFALLQQFAADRNTHSERWYRLFNEAPALLLIAIVILVVLKPF